MVVVVEMGAGCSSEVEVGLVKTAASMGRSQSCPLPNEWVDVSREHHSLVLEVLSLTSGETGPVARHYRHWQDTVSISGFSG